MYAFIESSGQKEDELAPEEDLLMESWHVEGIDLWKVVWFGFGSGGFQDAIWQGVI